MTWFDFLVTLETALGVTVFFLCLFLGALTLLTVMKFLYWKDKCMKIDEIRSENKTLKSLIRGDKEEK